METWTHLFPWTPGAVFSTPGTCHVCKYVCGLLRLTLESTLSIENFCFHADQKHTWTGMPVDGVSLAPSPDSLAWRPRLGHIAVPLQCLLRAVWWGEHSESLSPSSPGHHLPWGPPQPPTTLRKIGFLFLWY